MKLLINTASTHKGGAVQVAKSFIEECIKYPENTYHIIIGPSLRYKFKQDAFPVNFYFHEIAYRPSTRVFSIRPTATFFKKLEKDIKPDVVFTTSGPAYWRPRSFHIIGYNLPHYVYPESPFFNRLSFFDKCRWRLKGVLQKHFFNRDADAYVVQTDDVNNRVKKWLRNNRVVFTVPNICNHYYFSPIQKTVKLPTKKENEFRLLFFSAYYPHKNFELIPKIIDKIANQRKTIIRFVVTLEQDVYESLFPVEYRKNVLNVGPVNPEDGPSLYHESDAMFLPSLLECFSASYPEAMAMGKPIITSDLEFAHSICGGAAIYFNPLDPVAAWSSILNLFENKELQNNLIEKGKERLKHFPSPEERAKQYLSICKKFVNKEI